MVQKMAETALIILNYNDADTTEKLISLVRGYKALPISWWWTTVPPMILTRV